MAMSKQTECGGVTNTRAIELLLELRNDVDDAELFAVMDRAIAALVAHPQQEAVAGYVDPEQMADMKRTGGSVGIGAYSKNYGRTIPVYWHPAPDCASLEKVRQAVADYIASEGCGCCENREAHEAHTERLAELLGVQPYDDGSGWNFTPYRTATQQDTTHDQQ